MIDKFVLKESAVAFPIDQEAVVDEMNDMTRTYRSHRVRNRLRIVGAMCIRCEVQPDLDGELAGLNVTCYPEHERDVKGDRKNVSQEEFLFSVFGVPASAGVVPNGRIFLKLVSGARRLLELWTFVKRKPVAFREYS